jgi:hypothetical protein
LTIADILLPTKTWGFGTAYTVADTEGAQLCDGGTPALARSSDAEIDAMIQYMVDGGMLFEEEGVLALDGAGERDFGSRNFMERFSVFSSPMSPMRPHGKGG